MNEKQFAKELSKGEERLLAELFESKYFEALEHLLAIQNGNGMTSLLARTLSNDELRYWQGFVAGVSIIPKLIGDIRDRVQKEGFGE